MLRFDSNIRLRTSNLRSQQKYLKLFTTLNDLSKFDLANPSDLELVGLLNFDPPDLPNPSDPADLPDPPEPSDPPEPPDPAEPLDLPEPPDPPEPSDPPEPPDPAEPPEPLNPLNPLILTFCRTFPHSLLLAETT